MKAFITNKIPFNCYVQTLLQCDYCKQESPIYRTSRESMQDQKKQPNTVSEEDEVSSSSKEEMSATEVAQALRQDPNIFYIDLQKKT